MMHTRPDLTALDVIVPVGHVSAECRHERNANRQGDMHAYGNWMGRKPLALLNALIIAAHLPATVAPTLLLQQLLALLECDQTALDARDPVGASQQFSLFADDDTLTTQYATRIERSTPFDVRRPLPDAVAWRVADAVGSTARTLPELLASLAMQRLGHPLLVADPLCGNGTTGVAATRLGVPVIQADVHPVAALQSWALLHVGGRTPRATALRPAHADVLTTLQHLLETHQLETAPMAPPREAWLWTHDVCDPESGWWVPLFDSLVLHQASATVIDLVPDAVNRRFAIEIRSGVSARTLAAKARQGTRRHNDLVPPHHATTTRMTRIMAAQPEWAVTDWQAPAAATMLPRLVAVRTSKHQAHPHQWHAASTADEAQYQRVCDLLAAHWHVWHTDGTIPVVPLPDSDACADVRHWGMRAWHHLFTPRQLVLLGMMRTTVRQLAPHWDAAAQASAAILLNRWLQMHNRTAVWNADVTFARAGRTFERWTPAVQYVERALPNWASEWEQPLPALPVTAAPVACADVRQWAHPADLMVVDALPRGAGPDDDVPLTWLAPLLDTLPTSPRIHHTTLPSDALSCYHAILTALVAQLRPHGRIVLLLPSRGDAGLADVVLLAWLQRLHVTALWPLALDVARGQQRTGEHILVVVLAHVLPDVPPCYSADLVPDISEAVQTRIRTLRACDDAHAPTYSEYDLMTCGMGAALSVLTACCPRDIDAQRQYLDARMPRPQSDLLAHARECAHAALIPPAVPRALWYQLADSEQCALLLIVDEARDQRTPIRQIALTRGVSDIDSMCVPRSTLLILPDKLTARTGSFATSRMGQVWRILAQIVHPDQPSVASVLTHIPCDPTFVLLLLGCVLRITEPLPRWAPWRSAMQIVCGGIANPAHTGE